MSQLFTNNAASELAENITPESTTLTLKAGDGAKFPAPTNGDYFKATLYQKHGTSELNHEIVECSARADDVLTLAQRGLEGTLPRSFNAGDQIELRLTAGAVLPVRDDALTGALNEAETVRLASATSMAVGSANANTIVITGAATIAAFDAAPVGATRRTTFEGVLALTHNTNSLTLLTRANIATAAGDWCEWISTGAGKWTMTSYTRANGDSIGVVSLAKGGTGATTAPAARAALGAAPSVSPSFSNSTEIVHASGEVSTTLKSGDKYTRLRYSATDGVFAMVVFDGVTAATRLRVDGPTGAVAIAEGGGNVLIGTTEDDGSSRLQVNGAAKAASFVGPLTGNADTASKLATAFKINGVPFDGSADITIVDGTKQPFIPAGTAAQFYRGDKTWQPLNAAAVGLGNVNNTSDAAKPVSTATQTALNLKANAANPVFTGTVSGVTAAHVGLGNVNNTSDANKPISNATQAALDTKASRANRIGLARTYASALALS